MLDCYFTTLRQNFLYYQQNISDKKFVRPAKVSLSRDKIRGTLAKLSYRLREVYLV